MKEAVYAPREDSYLLRKYVEIYAKGKVLDMGTGSGVQALAALTKTKDVLAVDINENSIKEVKKLGIQAKVSDLFSNVKGKFDLIIFNPPYLPHEAGLPVALSGGKKGNEVIVRFLRQAKSHLKKNGKILLVASSLTGSIEQVCRRLGYKAEILETESYFFEKLSVYLIKSCDS